ncbi:MAG: hypothetical protein H5U40_15095, partial [Polyangiaceae bacterium]|nr:hypothetical protein [Polyangiaceae bacterium]
MQRALLSVGLAAVAIVPISACTETDSRIPPDVGPAGGGDGFDAGAGGGFGGGTGGGEGTDELPCAEGLGLYSDVG